MYQTSNRTPEMYMTSCCESYPQKNRKKEEGKYQTEVNVIKEVTLDNKRDHQGGSERLGQRSPFCVVSRRIGCGLLCEGLRSRWRKQQDPARNQQETGVGGGLWQFVCPQMRLKEATRARSHRACRM